MIQAIIYDLDDTLIDTSRLLIPIKDKPEFATRIREPLPTFPGALENLIFLAPRYLLFLVTHGEIEIQRQKISSAGLEPFFRSVYFSNSHLNEDKRRSFRRVSLEFGLPPEKILSFGNRIQTDLIPACELGMKTCLFSYGEHRQENAGVKCFSPNWTIDRHEDFLVTCGLLEGSLKKV